MKCYYYLGSGILRIFFLFYTILYDLILPPTFPIVSTSCIYIW